jgi:uncharacterized membrane protein
MNEITGQTSIVINAPVPAVYAYLLDFTRHPEWVRNLQAVRQESSGPIGVGTTFQTQEGPPPVSIGQKLSMLLYFLTGVLSGAKTYSRAEITALEPNRRIAWKAGVPKGDGYFNLAHWELLLEPHGQATHLVQRFSYQPQNGLARRMIDAAGASGLEQACAISLGQLKQRLELNATRTTGQPVK